MITEDDVQQRIKALIKERDDYVVKANQQIAAYEGAITALRGLIKAEESKGEEVK